MYSSLFACVLHGLRTCRCPQRSLESLELELQMMVTHCVSARNQTQVPGRAAGTLNHWVISSDQFCLFWWPFFFNPGSFLCSLPSYQSCQCQWSLEQLTAHLLLTAPLSSPAIMRFKVSWARETNIQSYLKSVNHTLLGTWQGGGSPF